MLVTFQNLEFWGVTTPREQRSSRAIQRYDPPGFKTQIF
jgi:hypothetical protein